MGPGLRRDDALSRISPVLVLAPNQRFGLIRIGAGQHRIGGSAREAGAGEGGEFLGCDLQPPGDKAPAGDGGQRRRPPRDRDRRPPRATRRAPRPHRRRPPPSPPAQRGSCAATCRAADRSAPAPRHRRRHRPGPMSGNARPARRSAHAPRATLRGHRQDDGGRGAITRGANSPPSSHSVRDNAAPSARPAHRRWRLRS